MRPKTEKAEFIYSHNGNIHSPISFGVENTAPNSNIDIFLWGGKFLSVIQDFYDIEKKKSSNDSSYNVNLEVFSNPPSISKNDIQEFINEGKSRKLNIIYGLVVIETKSSRGIKEKNIKIELFLDTKIGHPLSSNPMNEEIWIDMQSAILTFKDGRVDKMERSDFFSPPNGSTPANNINGVIFIKDKTASNGTELGESEVLFTYYDENPTNIPFVNLRNRAGLRIKNIICRTLKIRKNASFSVEISEFDGDVARLYTRSIVPETGEQSPIILKSGRSPFLARANIPAPIPARANTPDPNQNESTFKNNETQKLIEFIYL